MEIKSLDCKGYVLDHLGLVAATIEKLDLIQKIDQRLPVSFQKGSKVSMGQRLSAMILNGLGFIDDRLYIFPASLSNKPVERLLGEGLVDEDFNDDVLGRFLDAVYEYGTTKLFTEIAFEVAIENNLLDRSIHFDTTSLSVYGEYDGCTDLEEAPGLPETAPSAEATASLVTTADAQDAVLKPIEITHGYAKNKRFDLKQIVINLATTGASGFPLWMEAHNGNASDKTILVQSAQRMKCFCEKLKGVPDFLYVGDSAMFENSVKHGGDMKWLSRVPHTIKEAQEWVRQPDEAFTWSDQGNGYRTTPLVSAYGGVPQRWLLVSSEQAQERERKTLEKRISKEEASLKQDLWHLSNKPFACEADAHQAWKACMKRAKYHSATVVVTSVKKHIKRGRPGSGAEAIPCFYSIDATLARNEENILLAQREKGRFILATNQLDKEQLPDQDILPEYKGQSKTESGFRFIKNNAFEVSSVFLKKPERIEALSMVMTLCLMVYSFSQHHLREALKKGDETIPDQRKKPTQKPSMAWVYRMFHGVQWVHVQISGTVFQTISNLTELKKKIIRFFGKRAEYIYGILDG